MFEKVLIGVDGRSGGRDAIAFASALAGPAAELTLAHVDSGAVLPSHAINPGLLLEGRKASDDLLELERSAAGVSAKLLSIASGSPGAGLHEQAEMEHADLLVVGSCSHGTLGRAMLGDDTRAALNGAPCAVAIASVGYADSPTPIAKIGVAYNGSSESAAALTAARELSRSTGAAVHALEVVSIPTVAYTGIVAPAIGESIDLMLQEATSRMDKLPDVAGRAVYGLPGEELASFSGEVDLLIVGSRGYGPVKRLVLGSTSNFLERHARCPLLVLPRAAGNEEGNAAELETEAPAGAPA